MRTSAAVEEFGLHHLLFDRLGLGARRTSSRQLRPQIAVRLTCPHLTNRLVRNPKKFGQLRPTPRIRKDGANFCRRKPLLVQRPMVRHLRDLNLLLEHGVVVKAPAIPAALTPQPIRPDRGAIGPPVRRDNFPEGVRAVISHSSAE